MYTYDVKVWDLSIVQGPVSVAPVPNRYSRLLRRCTPVPLVLLCMCMGNACARARHRLSQAPCCAAYLRVPHAVQRQQALLRPRLPRARVAQQRTPQRGVGGADTQLRPAQELRRAQLHHLRVGGGGKRSGVGVARRGLDAICALQEVVVG
jgi:hypothetical protein